MRTEKDGEARRFRTAKEFERNAPLGEDATTKALRAFPDGNGRMRAGLYATEEPRRSDSWAFGEVLTDLDDEAMAKNMLPGKTEAQAEVLLSIAYNRLEEAERMGNETWKDLRIRVPTNLKVWAVRICKPETAFMAMPKSWPSSRGLAGKPSEEPEWLLHTMATSEEVAVAVAAHESWRDVCRRSTAAPIP